MKHTPENRIFRREFSYESPAAHRAATRRIYGDRRFIDDLDIVNELGGHFGCVNALSWSRSGRFLASGSDDRHVNIHTYLPDQSTAAFKLSTSISSGHTQNIFSVKFMPHSNDRTVVSCAGDQEVRVFDIEYSGKSTTPSIGSTRASAERFGIAANNSFWKGLRNLDDGNTDCRVYRSHSDRVKRIVTESSPYHFLTCSEDGEVRQWDLRQPSSAYPASSSSRSARFHQQDSGTVPPPLISYKRFNLDLNTISCSANQPHYIALGGAHLHCFLHDRRMIGRDRSLEEGRPALGHRLNSASTVENNLLSQATRCVKKFAPSGQTKMKRGSTGHITACKISDRYPNELIVSWSRDSIYSFDLVKSPGCGEGADAENQDLPIASSTRNRDSTDLKRKRSNKEPAQPLKSPRRSLSAELELEDIDNKPQPASAFRDHFHEEIEENVHQSDVSDEEQEMSTTIVERTAKIRRNIFREMSVFLKDTSEAPITSLSSILNQCASLLPILSDTIKAWRYPVDPSAEEIRYQNTLRALRESTRRFVQAAGTIAKVMMDTAEVLPEERTTSSSEFETIMSYSNDRLLSSRALFCYRFLKAILAWILGGVRELRQTFARAEPTLRSNPWPYMEEDQTDTQAIYETIIPYLKTIADDRPIVDVDTSKFEKDATRFLFESATSAVEAFEEAIKAYEAHNISLEAELTLKNKQIMWRYWGYRVARSLLSAAEAGFSLSSVAAAFGESHDFASEGDDLVLQNEEDDVGASNDEDQDGISGANEEEERDTDSDSEDDTEEESNAGNPLFSSRMNRRGIRIKAEASVHCGSHTRSYKGHANVQTVKDVGFYGLDDEYVVSGSDDGNFFIWDKKTSQLLNILEGDGECVNVIQGHPSEPMLAVSGIDHTIKIFSPDPRAQAEAQAGIGVTKSLSPGHSSLRHGRRPAHDQNRPRSAGDREVTADLDKLTSKQRMSEQYNIVANNQLAQEDEGQSAMFTICLMADLELLTPDEQNQILHQIAEQIRQGDFGGQPLVLDERCNILIAADYVTTPKRPGIGDGQLQAQPQNGGYTMYQTH